MIEIENMLIRRSNCIKAGDKYKLYMLYCTACKKFKRILSSAPCGPGGTLTCPICKERKQYRGIEMSYGNVKVKSFDIILPEEINNGK